MLLAARADVQARLPICQMLQITSSSVPLFLGNWSMALIGPIPSDWLSVLWSVCVEEQFYLIVPLLIALVLPRYRLPAGRLSARRLDRGALACARFAVSVRSS